MSPSHFLFNTTMTRITLTFSPAPKRGEAGRLCYRIMHRRTSYSIISRYSISPSEWNAECGQIRWRDARTSRSAYLKCVHHCTEWELARMRERLLACTSEDEVFGSAAELAGCLADVGECRTVFEFIADAVSLLQSAGRQGTARTYTSTLSSLRRYRQGDDFCFCEVDAAWVERYEAWMLGQGLVRNTTSFYLRTFRTIWRKAAAEGLCSGDTPFGRGYTGFDRTRKRAIGKKELQRLRQMDLSGNDKLSFARDMFLLSFYMRGIPFVDLAHLRKSDLQGGYLVYRRRKTHRQQIVKWEKCMAEIVGRYAQSTCGEVYLLPILCAFGADAEHSYRRALRIMNSSLTRLARLAGIDGPLTTYVARHTWATVARRMNVPLAAISEGMGHDSERTTRIYLADLDTSAVDRASRLVINSI